VKVRIRSGGRPRRARQPLLPGFAVG